jgi:ribosome-binding factor A
VEITSDLKYARVYVSVMGTPQEQKEAMKAFTSARGWLRRELAHRMSIRAVPELQFKLDTSIEYSDNISRLLNELKEADSLKESIVSEEGSSEEVSRVEEGPTSDTL